ncbi:eukaryotic translation initiation factor 5B [Arthroderma uncinatum]|uniref:eukaryotic translation initiation factor 5B n=1 Tax=Arthroderma uncinatum TaxID=74035 RepID=UPI00144AF906|nr:eukaryotic translation initiation factor 5B [Arthroderma uncinatum]KAF3482971.1 eukaryotic translation initiation factor 5B [Arthroderma uncinatum]
MAPKKKSNKQADDWEAELGESIAPASQQEKEPEAEAAGQEEDDAMGGGLLAALRKNKNKKAKKGKPTNNDFVEGEDLAADLSSKQPEEGTFDEDDVFAGKPKPAKGAGKKEPVKPAADAEEGGKLKSKKEKEREKKEREKQRKKEQAAKKKTTGTTPAAEPAPKAEAAKAAPAAAKPAPAPAAEPAGKKKKLPAHLAAIQRQQEALRKQQEEEERRQELEKTLAEEERKKLEEEERRKEELRQKRKEKEREKKEQLRREGKLLTKAQKDAKEHNELRMKQLLEAGGAIVAGLEEKPAEKKKPVYDSKKKRAGKKQEEDLEAAAARAKAQHEAEEAERKRLEEEKAKAAAAEAAQKVEESDDEIKDSWDVSSDEEDEGKAEEPSTTEKESEAAAKESESESESEEDSEDEDISSTQKAIAQRKAEAAERRRKQHEEALAAQSKDDLRSPICCILGHVDTGKTKLLDKIRQTNVQEGEAGGITQQIGATYFPVDALIQKTAVVNKDGKFDFKVPGLLVIDTPGHESFSNLRSRGSSLCNIAILVVDIMHGLEPQTLESMKLLRDRKTPFIVALNKIDRLFGWKKIDNNGFQDSLAKQSKTVQGEFKDRVNQTKLAFAEQGFNSELYWENKSMARNVSLVPTSAHTGEGVPDMLKLLVTLTQERMTNALMYLSEVECTVLEVKVIEGLGTTIDVVLSNGVLREGDRIVLCGLNGAIVTNIRALLTPAPMKELRLKSAYVHNKEVKAALGVKIAANDLEHAIAGSRLLVVNHDDDEDDLTDEVMSDLENLLSRVSRDNRGVAVQASTLEGALRLLTPIAAVKTNPVTGLKEVISLGRVMSIERDHKQLPICKKGQPSVAIKIEGPNQPLYGRQLEEKDVLYSMISRKSIDTLKEFYRSDVSMEEWGLIKKLKPLFDIP